MKKIMNGKKIFFPLFLICFAAIIPNKNWIYLFISLFIILSVNWRNINIKYLNEQFQVIKYFLLILIPGLLIGTSNEFSDYLRDTLNYLFPILIFLIGYSWGGKVPFIKIYHTVIYSSFIISLLKIFTINTVIGNIFSGHNYLLILGLFFLCIRRQDFEFALTPSYRLFLSFPMILSTIMLDQRSLFIGFFILFIFGNGFLKIKRKINLKFFVTGITTIGLLSSFLLFFLSNNVKFSESFNEIIPSNYSNNAEINIYWRGFEAYKGLIKFEKYNLLNKFLGGGFGELTPIGFTMKLKNYSTATIPHFHNFYIDIIVKSGLLGIFGFMLFLLSNYKKTLLSNGLVKLNKSRMLLTNHLIAIIFFILFSTLIAGGFFGIKVSLIIVIYFGYLVRSLIVNDKYSYSKL